eukprot:COSAG01_NODE_1183_length_11346_cov_263.800302_16_plen_69_part_00
MGHSLAATQRNCAHVLKADGAATVVLAMEAHPSSDMMEVGVARSLTWLRYPLALQWCKLREVSRSCER